MKIVSNAYWSLGAAGPVIDEAEAWRTRGLCVVDPESWFPEVGDYPVVAKKVCSQCPVKPECLDFALEHEVQHGVWGGMTDGERRRLLRGRHAA